MENHENSLRDKRIIKRTILNLRATVGSFTSKSVQLEADLQHVSNGTVRRYKNELGYHYCPSKKKRLMTETDKKLRVAFAGRFTIHKLRLEFWRSGIIVQKNPLDQALAPGAREWRMRAEQLTIGCTARGKKEGNQQVNFMVAIGYEKGTIMCTQHQG